MVADPLGKIYNKESVIEWLLERASGGSGSGGGRYGDGERICGYVRGVKVSGFCLVSWRQEVQRQN